MIIFVALFFIWTLYRFLRLIRAKAGHLAANITEVRSQPRSATVGWRGDRRNDPYPTWSALDDHQLTRLLISAAPQPTNEEDHLP